MKYRLQRLVLRMMRGIFRILPHDWAMAFGKGLGALGYHLARGRRRTALENLEAAFRGEKTPDEIQRIALASFQHLGIAVAEFLRFLPDKAESLRERICVEGEENLEKALEGGRGALILSAHLGNWELVGLELVRRGYPMAIVTKIARDRAVDEFLTASREGAGIKVFQGRGLFKESLRHLAKGGVLGSVLDQNARRREGVFVPFFGRQACTLKSLALLARRTGAPIVPIFAYREGWRHRIVCDPPLDPGVTEDMEGDVVRWTAACAEEVEKAIRRRPEQWMWLHNRWKTSPNGSPEFRVQSPEEKREGAQIWEGRREKEGKSRIEKKV
ncbi:MAG: lysophospholipid acyltransferase family protein [Proteobacteria bacterium]|nr:lysophospholipid acyltransferase family protein [Pseudomonadota bacterium]